jgi:hypothetical protein
MLQVVVMSNGNSTNTTKGIGGSARVATTVAEASTMPSSRSFPPPPAKQSSAVSSISVSVPAAATFEAFGGVKLRQVKFTPLSADTIPTVAITTIDTTSLPPPKRAPPGVPSAASNVAASPSRPAPSRPAGTPPPPMVSSTSPVGGNPSVTVTLHSRSPSTRPVPATLDPSTESLVKPRAIGSGNAITLSPSPPPSSSPSTSSHGDLKQQPSQRRGSERPLPPPPTPVPSIGSSIQPSSTETTPSRSSGKFALPPKPPSSRTSGVIEALPIVTDSNDTAIRPTTNYGRDHAESDSDPIPPAPPLDLPSLSAVLAGSSTTGRASNNGIGNLKMEHKRSASSLPVTRRCLHTNCDASPVNDGYCMTHWHEMPSAHEHRESISPYDTGGRLGLQVLLDRSMQLEQRLTMGNNAFSSMPPPPARIRPPPPPARWRPVASGSSTPAPTAVSTSSLPNVTTTAVPSNPVANPSARASVARPLPPPPPPRSSVIPVVDSSVSSSTLPPSRANTLALPAISTHSRAASALTTSTSPTSPTHARGASASPSPTRSPTSNDETSQVWYEPVMGDPQIDSSAIDDYGFEAKNGSEPPPPEKQIWRDKYHSVTNQQGARWRMLGQPSSDDITGGIWITSKLRSSKGYAIVRCGIPVDWRSDVWEMASGAREALGENDGYYHMVMEQLKQRPTKSTRDIEKDVRRTMQNHPKFKSKEGTGLYSSFNIHFSFCC